MESRDKEMLVKLAGENPELAALMTEHQSLESRLEEMNHRPYLAPEEDLERKKIQKAKLAVKDRIQEFLDRIPR